MDNWTENEHALHKTFIFSTFLDAMNWMVRASAEIERQNHHPSWTNEYNKVHVYLSTHDEGNIISQKDWALAQIMDSLYENGY